MIAAPPTQWNEIYSIFGLYTYLNSRKAKFLSRLTWLAKIGFPSACARPLRCICWLKKSIISSSETPKGIFPTYNLRACRVTVEPTTGTAACNYQLVKGLTEPGASWPARYFVSFFHLLITIIGSGTGGWFNYNSTSPAVVRWKYSFWSFWRRNDGFRQPTNANILSVCNTM